MWAARIVHESSLYDDQHGSCFLTLTYRDSHECTSRQLKKGYHLPSDGSLHPSHLRNFIKRLRKSLPQKIRYFAVGEYGDESFRPHYHVILFNHDFSDSVAIREKEGIWLYESDTLSRLWPYGFSTIGEVNWQTAAYCARYCVKKVNGEKANEYYLRHDDELGYEYWLEPEFIRMSLKPGIGKEWFDRYKKDFFPRDEVPVPGKRTFYKMPRYYDKLMEKYDPEGFQEVKTKRKLAMMENASEYSHERLMAKYKVKKAQVKMLKREL